jgi:glycine/D-amino acid oxidase-like deaminating enzyme
MTSVERAAMLLSSNTRATMPDQSKFNQSSIIVIGAGIIGASLAYHLAKSGARVTVIEAAEPGGIATRNSWAWINASWGNPEPYFRLRRQSMADWRRLAAEVPEIMVDWVGGLIWDLPRPELEAYAAEHAGWGYGIRAVDGAEALRLEPALSAAPDFALHVAEEGAVDPTATALALLAAAQRQGAVLRRERVLSLDVEAGRVTGITTASGRQRADTIVIAAGAETASLAATADVKVPMSTPPGLLVATKPCAKLLNGLVMSPSMHVRQLADGSLLAGADFGGSDPGRDALATATAVFAGLQRLLKKGEALVYDRYQIGYRPMPADGFPILGPARPGLYLAMTHSGITLAPLLGRFGAAEILGAGRDPLLAPYGWGRFEP